MNTTASSKLYNPRSLLTLLMVIFILSIFSITLYRSKPSQDTTSISKQPLTTDDVQFMQGGAILNAEDVEFDGITPEKPPSPEAVKTLTEDKIIISLSNINFRNNSVEDILNSIEKIYTQEITEELKSIEL